MTMKSSKVATTDRCRPTLSTITLKMVLMILPMQTNWRRQNEVDNNTKRDGIDNDVDVEDVNNDRCLDALKIKMTGKDNERDEFIDNSTTTQRQRRRQQRSQRWWDADDAKLTIRHDDAMLTTTKTHVLTMSTSRIQRPRCHIGDDEDDDTNDDG